MKRNRPVRVILKGQAKASFEKLNCIVGEQEGKWFDKFRRDADIEVH